MRVEDSPFDAQHYALPIGRLVVEPGDDAAALTAAVARAAAAGYALLVIRVAAGEPMRAVLDAAGHAPVDVLVTSTLARAHPPPVTRDGTSGVTTGVTIEHVGRLDDPRDVEAVAALTAAGITRSHLHADPRLPLERTRALYGAWARNDVTGRAQRVIVARHAGAIVGYIAVLVRAGHAIIDLVAVTPALQGRGIGSALLGGFLAWVAGEDVVATVGTQADNPALALYRRCGFEPTAQHITYHLWLR